MVCSPASKFIITGCSTGVGKTVVSAIVATALQADYWKPVQCGGEGDSDTEWVRNHVAGGSAVHLPAYDFKHPCSPHQAERLDGIAVDPGRIYPPQTSRRLVIETAGGILVPWNMHTLAIDRFTAWDGIWIVVSRHYLGSINHTLLTIEALKRRHCTIGGIIFNGIPHPDSEEAILQFAQVPYLARLLPEEEITKHMIQEYANQWRHSLEKLMH